MIDSERKSTATINFNRGLSALYSGKYDIAINAFGETLAYDNDHVAAHAGLCLAYHEMDLTLEMFEAFEQIPVGDDSLGARLLVIAVAYYADSEYLLALKKIHHSLKFGTIEAFSYYVLGRTLLALRRYKWGLLALRRAHEQSPYFSVVKNLIDWTSNYLDCEVRALSPILHNAVTLLHQPPPTVDDIPKYNILHDQVARDYLQLTGRFRALDD